MKLMVELNITSFRGSIGGEHYYGKFVVHYSQKHDGNQTDVERPIDQAEADYLNKKDGNDPNFYWIKAGDMVTRFNSEQQLRDRAREVFVDLFGTDAVLYINNAYPVEDPDLGAYWENGYTPLWRPEDVERMKSITRYGQKTVRKMMEALGHECNI